MSWTTLLTLLGLVAGTAYLVVLEQWSYESAVLTMLGVGLVLLAALTTAIFLMTPAGSRAGLWRAIQAEMKREIQEIRKAFWKS